MFDASPMQDNSEDAWIDSVLYADQSNPNFPSGIGYGSSYYVVTAYLDGKEIEVYEGHDYDRAEREAISAYKRYHGKAYVPLDTDGGSWKYVFGYPSTVKSEPVVIPTGGCPDPRCGQINPLECWCVYSMTDDQKKRYAEYY